MPSQAPQERQNSAILPRALDPAELAQVEASIGTAWTTAAGQNAKSLRHPPEQDGAAGLEVDQAEHRAAISTRQFIRDRRRSAAAEASLGARF